MLLSSGGWGKATKKRGNRVFLRETVLVKREAGGQRPYLVARISYVVPIAYSFQPVVSSLRVSAFSAHTFPPPHHVHV
jgi:hypothetical protein